MIRTAVIAFGMGGLALVAAAPASAQPTTTFSCSPCIILEEFLLIPGQTVGNIAGLPGQAVNNVVMLPGQAVGNVTSLPGQAVGNIRDLPGQAIGNVTSLPGQAIGNVTSLPGHAADNLKDLVGINDGKLDGGNTGDDPDGWP
jgi:hypothetical protein